MAKEKPDDEIDRKSGEVMGWEIHQKYKGINEDWYFNPNIKAWITPVHNWHPTHRIEQAVMVVEKMMENDFWFSSVYKEGIALGAPGYEVRFRCVRGATRGAYVAYSKTLPMATCLAAIKAAE